MDGVTDDSSSLFCFPPPPSHHPSCSSSLSSCDAALCWPLWCAGAHSHTLTDSHNKDNNNHNHQALAWPCNSGRVAARRPARFCSKTRLHKLQYSSMGTLTQQFGSETFVESRLVSYRDVGHCQLGPLGSGGVQRVLQRKHVAGPRHFARNPLERPPRGAARVG